MTSQRLARLVRLKKLAEQARATELIQQRGELKTAEGALAATHEAMQAADAAVPGVVTGSELMALSEYQEALVTRAARQRVVISEQEEAVRLREEAVRSAWIDRRSMQSVQERAVERERADEARKERKTMEELTLSLRGHRGEVK